jgi:hypothetical protein
MITAEIPLEMLGSWLFNDEFDVTYTCTEIEIDPADYPGLVEAWFELVVETHYATYSGAERIADGYRIDLVDEDGTVAATHLLLPPWTLPQRVRVPATLSSSKKKYYVKVWGYPDTFADVDLRTARVILKLVDTNRIRVQIPLFQGDGSTGGGGATAADDDFWAWGQYVYNPTYAYAGWDGTDGYWWDLFLKTEANWQTVDHWTLEVIGTLGASPYAYDDADPIVRGPFYVALFNKTTGLMVTGTEVSFDQTDKMPHRATIDFANDAANFTDGDEFEIRVRLEGGGLYLDNNVGLLYRAELYCTLAPVTKIEVYMKFGTVVGSFGVIGSYDQESRWLFESDLFPLGTEYFLETTFGNWLATPRERVRSAEVTLVNGHRYLVHLYKVGATYYLCAYNGYDADYGSMVYTRSPTVATVITNGSLSDPGGVIPAITEGWLDGTWDPIFDYHGFYTSWDNKIAAIQLNTPNDTAIIELGGFGFQTVIPPGLAIQGVGAWSSFGCIGPPQWVDDFVPSMGSGTPVNAYVDMSSFVGGVQQGSWHAGVCSNYFLLNPGWDHFDLFYPQTLFPQPAPAFIPISGGSTYVFNADRAWVDTDLADGTFTVRIRTRMPNVARLLQWFFCYATAQVTVGTDFLCLSSLSNGHGMSFIIAVVEGTASPACLWVSATIDSATMVVTGTGLGENATEWKVVRLSDNAIMASGVGNNASFSFVGAYGVTYQLQYRYWV